MILLDPRAGSADYLPLLKALGAPVEPVTLEFGDVTFYAPGFPRGIGIELKKFDDILTCVTTGRFSGHQLRGMAIDYAEQFLIIEGLWRPNPSDGVLETWGWNHETKKREWIAAGRGRRRWQYRDFDAYLNTQEIKGGIRIKRTTTPDETARVVYGLYNWWQDYEGHRSHLALNRAGRDGAIFFKPTFARRVATELPGVGFERSGDVAAAFPTVRRMLDATPKEWAGVKGIGKTLAKRIVEAWDSAA